MQEVKPLKKVERKETQLTVWIPTELNKQMKLYALENDLTLKEVVDKAIHAFIGNMKG